LAIFTDDVEPGDEDETFVAEINAAISARPSASPTAVVDMDTGML